MSTEETPLVVPPTTIIQATAAALVAAIVILVIAVFPAEYGVDLTGLGSRIGFTRLYGEKASQSVARHKSEMGKFATHTIEIPLGPKQGLEYKFVLKQGGMLVYNWAASTPVEYDFHGEREGDPSGNFESYDKKAGDNAGGSFIAPFAGTHGWFWKNPTIYPITIKLTAAGFFEVKGLVGAPVSRATNVYRP